ncbi:hypothetical protein J6590_007680 [Homalodisca vitripennis]|nr:hypothetical protein J6590_007680 [Homalodisca vitripennis]
MSVSVAVYESQSFIARRSYGSPYNGYLLAGALGKSTLGCATLAPGVTDPKNRPAQGCSMHYSLVCNYLSVTTPSASDKTAAIVSRS